MRLTKFLLNRFLMCVNEEKPSFVNCQRLATFLLRLSYLHLTEQNGVILVSNCFRCSAARQLHEATLLYTYKILIHSNR